MNSFMAASHLKNRTMYKQRYSLLDYTKVIARFNMGLKNYQISKELNIDQKIIHKIIKQYKTLSHV